MVAGCSGVCDAWSDGKLATHGGEEDLVRGGTRSSRGSPLPSF